MKVVLFCGGLGTRLREHSETIPKPLVDVGGRPIIWHLMNYYAGYGHKDFILCLGYRADMIRRYFLDYNPYLSADFVMEDGGRKLSASTSDISEWRITFVDTGLHSNLGGRLLRVREYLEGEDAFLANYSDQLSDLPFDQYLDRALKHGVTASFVSVKPQQSFHNVEADEEGFVERLRSAQEAEYRINGGYFVLRREIFDAIEPGEELVEEPFARLAEQRQLWTYRYDGFWRAIDTFKDKIIFDRMDGGENRPWLNRG
jgi:glucose-1-phosphate cytidylyltransferase